MKNTLFYTFAFVSFLGLFSCNSNDSSSSSDAPQHAIPSNIYEVNVRQFTPEGSFAAFQSHLPRLKQLGVDMLWFMPITPISEVDRKGSLGSYYAVKDYKGVNPEFGNIQDWKNLVKAAHAQGMKVIIDWVANHTGADNAWLTNHPDFYVRDANGNAVYAFDWSDTRDLNYDNPALQDSMIAAMQYWVQETDIDGFRCDVAGEVPTEFWQKAISTIRSNTKKELFFLAEAEKPELIEAGFNASYGWKHFHTMVSIAKGEKSVLAIDTVLQQELAAYPDKAKFIYFTSNHDENSWNGADYNTMPGKKHNPFAVLTQTLPAAIPLIYSGQEEPILRAISFFEKDTIPFKAYVRAPFYKKLQDLRLKYRDLFENGSFERFSIGNNDQVYAFSRKYNDQEIIVITNLSDIVQNIHVDNEIKPGDYTELFTNEQVKHGGHYDLYLNAWDYKILIKK